MRHAFMPQVYAMILLYYSIITEEESRTRTFELHTVLYTVNGLQRRELNERELN